MRLWNCATSILRICLGLKFSPKRHRTARAIYSYLRNLERAVTRLLGMDTAPTEPANRQAPDGREQPSLPETYPLTSLEDLENLSCFHSFHFPFNRSSVPLPIQQRISLRNAQRPRLLVCHDMRGGYQDDRWVQGSPNSDAYSIWHWHLIDIFVYFSHSLVTLPPPCWVNAAHRHGVQVLGTFITEWDAGKLLCERLLASKDSVFLYASRLAKVAEVLGFDGWLINIENVVEKSYINNLLEFVRILTKLMRESVPGSTVIWYDSVTTDGTLDWQDCLNEHNKCFFDLCDGIFTNYTWKESYPKSCAKMAGERRYDVYMGIDVFGRNTYGGGGFQSNIALTAAKDAGVSAALFAPGWVYETQQSTSFVSAQNRWWGLVAECWPSARRYPIDLPFFSNFNQGFWKRYFLNGREISTTPWSNISCQNLQPLLLSDSVVLQGGLDGAVSGDGPVYSGGACVKFSGSIDDESQCLITLYEANVEIDKPFHVTYTVRSNKDSSLSLLLRLSRNGRVNHIVLGVNADADKVDNGPFSDVVILKPQKADLDPEGWSFCSYRIETSGVLEEVVALSYSSKQRVADFFEKFHFASLSHPPKRVRLTKELPTFSYEAFLGHIAISTNHSHEFDEEKSFEELLNVSDVLWGDASGKRVVSLKLTWKHKVSTLSMVMNYDVFVCKGKTNCTNFEHLGAGMVGAFYVAHLDVPDSCHELTFVLQTSCKCGYSGSLDVSPSIGIGVS